MTPKRTIVVAVAVGVGLVGGRAQLRVLERCAAARLPRCQARPGLCGDQGRAPGHDRFRSGERWLLRAAERSGEVPALFGHHLLSELNGKEAVAPYAVGQVLVTSMFVSPTAAVSSFSQLIPAGDVAVEHLGRPGPQRLWSGVAGDKVDLFVTVNNQESSLLQNVPIVAVGQSTSSLGPAPPRTRACRPTRSPPPRSPTRWSTPSTSHPAQAASIAYAQQGSLGLYMALVPAGNPVVSIPPVSPGISPPARKLRVERT